MTLSASISSTGVTAPTYQEVLDGFKAQYQEIMGTSAIVSNDSKMGQLLAAFAAGVADTNDAVINTYNSFIPAYAQGAGLSSLVKINGLQRQTPSNSTTNVTIVGVAGTVILNGVISDANNTHQWTIPYATIIPVSGTITVQATCVDSGAIDATDGSLTNIVSATLGWQTVTNFDTTLGNPVETDAELRQRQAISTTFPASSIVTAIYAAIQNLPTVQKVVIYENDTNTTDSNGLTPHSIAAVVLGGDPIAICTQIALRKPPGTGTNGTTNETITIGYSVLSINYYTAEAMPIQVAITIHPLPGYTSSQSLNIPSAVINYLNTLSIGEKVYKNSVLAAASTTTYNVTSITLTTTGTGASIDSDGNVVIPFNGYGTAIDSAITVTVS